MKKASTLSPQEDKDELKGKDRFIKMDDNTLFDTVEQKVVSTEKVTGSYRSSRYRIDTTPSGVRIGVESTDDVRQ